MRGYSDNDIFVDDFLDNSVRPAFARLISDLHYQSVKFKMATLSFMPKKF